LGGIYLRGGLANELVANLIRANGQAGIHLDGPASQNLIAANQVLTNRGPGIALGPTAAGNLVQDNRLRQNNPDLRATLPAQTANRFVLNECQTSFPTGLGRRPTPHLGAAQPSPVQDNGRPSH
jgi:parallel beta-helix repeat protein